MDAEEEVRRLFDMSTVEEDLTRYRSPTKLVKNIITITRPVLRTSTVSISSEQFVRYDEVEIDEFALDMRINIVRPCGARAVEEGNSPCMPSLRLDMLDKEYQEPVRNRDKDWILHSQRPIINEKGNDIVSPKFSIPLGKYKQVDPTSKQFWAKEYQTMLRECRLLRKAAIISETNCIVEIHGVGFTGRMFSEGSTSPKLLVIEAYSIWNSQKYTIVLTVMELRMLLVENPELLRPGRRADLLKTLVKSLYFKYTITIPPKESPTNSRPHSKAAHDTSHGQDGSKSTKGRRPTKRQLRLEMKHKLQKELATHDHALTFEELHHKHTTEQPDAAEELVHAPVHVPHIHFFNKLENAEAPLPSDILQAHLHPPGHHLHQHRHSTVEGHYHQDHHGGGSHSPRRTQVHAHPHDHAPHSQAGHEPQHDSYKDHHSGQHTHRQEHHSAPHSERRDQHSPRHSHSHHHESEPHGNGFQDGPSPGPASERAHSARQPTLSRPVSHHSSRRAQHSDEHESPLHSYRDDLALPVDENKSTSPRPLHSQSVPYFQMDTPLSLSAFEVTEERPPAGFGPANPSVDVPADAPVLVEVIRELMEQQEESVQLNADIEDTELAPADDAVAGPDELTELMEMLASHHSDAGSEKGSTKSSASAAHEEPEVLTPTGDSKPDSQDHVSSRIYVCRVSHLDPPVMPRGYPTTVEQMIRLPPVLPENSTDPLPIVTQELHIGPVRLYNGIKLRKLQAVQKRIAEEKEEKRLLGIWLATPKRKRNLVCIRLVRRCNYLVLLTGYFDPMRPNTILMKGMVHSEATKMSMFLGLGKIKDILHLDTPCQAWSRDELKIFATKVLRYAGIVRTDFGGYAINVTQATGLEAMLRKVHTVNEFLASVRARQQPLLYSKMNDPDSLSPFYAPLLPDFPDDFGTANNPKSTVIPEVNTQGSTPIPQMITPQPSEVILPPLALDSNNEVLEDAVNTTPRQLTTEAELTEGSGGGGGGGGGEAGMGTEDEPRDGGDADSATQLTVSHPVVIQVFPTVNYPIVSNNRPSWPSLGALQSTRSPGKSLGALLRPFREIGRARRLTCQAMRVGHVHCIYSLYANTAKMASYRDPVPVWPVRDPNAASALDAESLASLAESEQKSLEEDEDQDFMKAGSDSGSGTDSDSDAGGSKYKKNKGRKTNKKPAIKTSRSIARTQSDSIDPRDALDGDLNEADEKNDAYASLAEGLVLELDVYIPAHSEYQGASIPSGTYKIPFTVDDLDKIFPAEEKELLFRALRVVYFKFFESATAEEVRTAETDWEYIGRCIMRKASWVRRTPLSPTVATAASDLQHSKLCIDLLQDIFNSAQRLEYVRTLLNSDAIFVPTVAAPPDDGALSASEKLLYAPMDGEAPTSLTDTNNGPYVTLTWSNIVHRKVIKVRSATSERGETVRLQVCVFQIGEGQGVVCYDREKNEVYFAQHVDEALLQSQIRGFRFISGGERSLQLYFFLTASLVYAEVDGQDGVKRGKVTFGAVVEEVGVIDNTDVIEGDYSAATEMLLNSATDKAQKRMKRK